MKAILSQKTLLVAALGYFVDLYDLVLFGAVRVESLRGIGVPAERLFEVGALLQNLQMAGMIVGGVFFGVLGDRRGRKSALFSSILVYSTATLLNAWVTDVPFYGLLRFIAGFGLAGELGAAITLASELLPAGVRGMGSAWIASIGFMGAACSSLLSEQLPWRVAYVVGGLLGFLLLLSRMKVRDPALFIDSKAEADSASFGSIQLLFCRRPLLRKLGAAWLAGIPIWYVAGILSTFAPEFGRALRISAEVSAGRTIFAGYLGAILGDIACGLLSQRLRSRKRAILAFLGFGALLALSHPLFLEGGSARDFYFVRFLIGFGNGYFATLIAWISESFGTNLRATATGILSNLIRASVIPLSLGFSHLIPVQGLLGASLLLGGLSFLLGLLGVLALPETFGRDLRYHENGL
jgi:putative MFS transporter